MRMTSSRSECVARRRREEAARTADDAAEQAVTWFQGRVDALPLVIEEEREVPTSLRLEGGGMLRSLRGTLEGMAESGAKIVGRVWDASAVAPN